MLLAHICQSRFARISRPVDLYSNRNHVSWIEELISADKVFHLWHRCHNFSNRQTCLCIPLTVQLWTSTTIGSLTALIIFISFWIYVTRCRAFLFSPPLDTCLKQICKCSEVLGSQWFEVQIETINCLILWQLQRFCCLIIVKPSFVNYFR